MINEITSDYRSPRPGDRNVSCEPGTWGYESIVPEEMVAYRWIKCMNSPLWVRENIGEMSLPAGVPLQDVGGFSAWLEASMGEPGEVVPVLFGLTVDCCVLSTAQELSWRGYEPLVLKEGVDHFNGTADDKEKVLATTLCNWAEPVTWEELKQLLRV